MRSVVCVLLLLVAVAATVSGARLRGELSSSMSPFGVAPQQQQQQQPNGDLVSFLQSHAQMYQQGSVGSQMQQGRPSAAAMQAAQSTIPVGAQDVGGSNILQAMESIPSHALVETHASQPPEEGAVDGGGEAPAEAFGPCKTCVFVLERIKKGSNMLLPAICSELYHKYPDAYALCHQVLNALSINGNNVRYWLFEGCFKYEIYQSKEWIKPCPSHVMCSVLKDLSANPFCPALPMENPFAAADGGAPAEGGDAGGMPAEEGAPQQY